jgi:hypothetical protein
MKFLFCVVGLSGTNGGNAKDIGARLDMIESTTGRSRPDFRGLASTALDGPPLFWKVHFYTSTGPSETRHFGTKEDALAFHGEVVKRIMSGEFQ